MWAIVFVVVAVGVAFAVGFRVGARASSNTREPQPPSVPPAALTHLRFDPITTPPPPLAALAECPPSWRGAMSELGQRLIASDVRAVVFVHGTFAGDDPISIARFARTALGEDAERVLRRFFKTKLDAWLGDAANYPPEYVRLFESAIGGAIPCVPFVWSSENHHIGRAIAAVRLVRFLASLAPLDDRPKRVLLFGHSHAGQVFAMATHLLEGGDGARAIAEAARACGEPIDDLDACIRRARKLSLDVATFGAPARYAWAASPRVRSMHVIHRRAPGRRVKSLRAFFRGDDHDGVQWLGTTGSDIPPISTRERRASKQLDGAFDAGLNPKAWVASVTQASHLPIEGHTVLVDYAGAHVARGAPKTLFGHAAYTRFEAMLFNARLVVDHFYPPREDVRLLGS
jgi:hypothetical protein